MARVLILDDDLAFRDGLAETLEDLGHDAVLSSTLEGGLLELRTERVSVVIVDLKLGGASGLEFLRRAALEAPEVPCLMLTAFANGRNTIEAMRLGAFDHLAKPIGRDALRAALDRALRRTGPVQAPAIAADPTADMDDDDLVGASESMRQVHKRVGMAAASEATVLVLGETGTGKELVARALHRNSARAHGPFVSLNCAAIPSELIESELFGHVKGAFSGAAFDRAGRFREADGGVLFLDEIGDMPLTAQSKMLRALQERLIVPLGGTRPIPVNVRIVAATHRYLPDMVKEGRFREDLWYRLQVVSITLPALRDRPGDVALLAEHFLRRGSRSTKTLAPDALRRLMSHGWPGNVRELRNAIERALVWSHGTSIEAGDLELDDTPGRATDDDQLSQIPWDGTLADAVEAVERVMVIKALSESQGNRTEAARRLGLHRQQLYRKLGQFGLE